MTKDEALDLALDWLVCYKDKSMSRNNAEELAEELITAIKQARSAPVQPCNPAEDGVCESVECCKQPAPVQGPDHGNELTIAYMSGLHDGKKKREWVSLTDEEVSQLIGGMPHGKMVRAIEAKLRSKNNG